MTRRSETMGSDKKRCQMTLLIWTCMWAPYLNRNRLNLPMKLISLFLPVLSWFEFFMETDKRQKPSNFRTSSRNWQLTCYFAFTQTENFECQFIRGRRHHWWIIPGGGMSAIIKPIGKRIEIVTFRYNADRFLWFWGSADVSLFE